MSKWFEVFAAGKHTSANGVTREWTEDDLEKMASSYNPDTHEAPIVVGHPKDNAPAYGWIDQLKVAGRKLLALPKQLEPQFAEMVNAGRFKKRSISVYPNGTLKHVGFLGAAAPAVKGLKDVTFSDEDQEIYEYQYTEEQSVTELEKLQAKLAQEKEARLAAEKTAGEFKEKAEKVSAEFAEAREKARRAEIDNFIEAGIKDAKILPAWKEQGLAEFMSALDESEQEYEFAEGDGKKTQSTWFRDFITSFAEHPLFKQMAAPEGDGDRREKADFAEDEKIADDIAGAYKQGE